MMDKKGMTLVELLVYIVLAGFLLAPVIMLVQNSSVNMARDASNVSLRMTGRELLNIIYDDLRNTGFKLNGFVADTAASYVNLEKYHEYVTACNGKDPGYLTTYGKCPANLNSFLLDVSSFLPQNKVGGDPLYDRLTVIMGKLNAAGGWVQNGIDTISYFVENRTLKRQINTGGKSLTLAKNVEALKFRYSEDLVNWYDDFTPTIKEHMQTKGAVQYIKAIIVLKDDKRLSPTKTTSITLINADDGGDTDYGVFGGEVPLTRGDQALYERHETVIPIPNNGLFPP